MAIFCFKETTMKSKWTLLAMGLLMSASTLAADASPFKDQKEQQSYAIGAQTGRTLKKDNVDIDEAMLIRGLKDGLGGDRMLLSEKELRAVMSHVQQELHKNMVMNRRALGERNKEEGARFLAENGKKPGVVTTSTGLQYRVIKDGNGAKPLLINTVSVNYRGTLADGVEFEASPDGKPVQLVVAQTVAGFKEALQLMSVGSKWQVVVPANLAYGDRGSGTEVGPNQVLLFDVELVGIK
jgi:FKBP-type peptidyl-prolyl cis-trans isomerase FklB